MPAIGMQGWLDQLPTELDILTALRAWQRPQRLAETRLARGPLAGEALPTSVRVAVLRDALLAAIRQLTVVNGQGELERSLTYQRYVLNRSVAEVCGATAQSPATLNRRVQLEIAELSVILARTLTATHAAPRPTPAPLALAVTPPADFVGRHAALARAKAALLRAEGALVAVTGLPGVGKTSLAAALIASDELRARFSDGVLWAAVGPDHGVQDCLAQWAAELGLPRGAAQDDLRRELRLTLASRRVLIVLDDVWRAEDAHALMLGGRGSAVLLLTRLPALAHALTPEVIALDDFGPDDVRALLEKHLPESELRAAGLSHTHAQLAEALSGLPLAASIAVRNLATLARTRQTRRFQAYLATPDAHRHAALDERLRASVDLLDVRLQRVLSLLAVFRPKPNTVSEALACAVTDCDAAALDALVDHGLLETTDGRYMLHSRVAEFAARLPGADAGRIALLYAVDARLADTASELPIAELLNVCTALSLAPAGDVPEHAERYARIACSAAWAFDACGCFGMLAPLLSAARERPMSEAQRAVIDLHLAQHAWRESPDEAHYAALQAQFECVRALGNAELTGAASRMMADAAFEHADVQTAIDQIHTATRTWRAFEATQRERVEATAIRRYMLRSPFERLRRLLVRVIPDALAKRVDSAQIMVAVTAKAWLDFLDGDPAGVPQLEAAVERSMTHGYRLATIFGAGGLAWAYQCLGDYNRARQMANHAIHAPFRDVFPDFVVQAYNTLGAAALAQGDLAAAWAHLSDGLSYAQSRGADSMACELQITLSDWYRAQDDARQALACATAAHRVARQLHFQPMIPSALTAMGASVAAAGDSAAAREHFAQARAALDAQRGSASPWVSAHFHLHCGECLAHLRAFDDAARELATAIALGERLGSAEYVGLGHFAYAQLHAAQGAKAAARLSAQQALTALRRIGHAGADRVTAWMARS